MFSTHHIIWLVISLGLIAGGVCWLKKRALPLRRVLHIMGIVCFLSEAAVIASTIQIVPSTDGTMFFPFIHARNYPLHLCSLQLVFVWYARYAKDGPLRDKLLAFMYPTCLIGAFLALMIPVIYTENVDPAMSFVHPLAYQFFLYHSALIILGIYIPLSGEVRIRGKHYLSTLGFLALLAYVSIYVNSILAQPTYENGVLISVDAAPNFFFTCQTPIGIPLTEVWHWYLYLSIIIVLAASLIALFYIPFFRRDLRERRAGKKNEE